MIIDGARRLRSRSTVVGVTTALWGALVSGGCAADTAPAPQPPAAARESECRWATGPVTIDGRADEAAWSGAQVIDHFYVPWLGKDARPAKTATKARLLWDRDYLYFFAEMQDTDLHADVKEHDGRMWELDVFEIFLRPSRRQQAYYEFEFNPHNAVLDMYLPARDAGGYEKFKADGEFDIRTAVRLDGTLNRRDDTDKGWAVEGRIAWKSLGRTGGAPAPGDTWTFALCRVDDSRELAEQELSTTAPLGGDKANFHRTDEYAPLKFVGPAQAPR